MLCIAQLLFPLISSQTFQRYDISECIGVWGSESAHIQVQISPLPTATTGNLAVAIFNFKERINIQQEELIPDYKLCTQKDLDRGTCLVSELNKFHIKQPVVSPILNEFISWSSSTTKHSDNVTFLSNTFKLTYNVHQTGYYCIFIGSDLSKPTRDFNQVFTVIQMNGGKLPAIFLPAMNFFIAQCVIYSVIGLLWMALSFYYWKDILEIQIYASAVITFLVIEMAFNLAFFEDFDNTGVASVSFLSVVVTLNAARTSISFLMLLLVSLGHGVVKPSLGTETTQKCLALTACHFVFGACYSSGTLVVDDVNSLRVLFLIIPLSITMSIFYSWIIKGTIAHLKSRRQGVKLLMYQSIVLCINQIGLYYILVFSMIGIFAILVANAINMSHKFETDWIESQWQWRWMLLDGALNLLFLIVFFAILILWMPSANNARYGLDQLPTEDYDDAVSLTRDEDDDSPIKLRTLAKQEDEENEDALLAWHEDKLDLDVDMTPSNSDDKLN